MSPVVKTSQRSRAIYYLTSLNVTSVCGSCLLSERQPRKGWQYLKQESWGKNCKKNPNLIGGKIWKLLQVSVLS